MTTDIPAAAEASPARSTVLVQTLIGSGHGLSHFYQLALPPLFPLLQPEFDVSYAALGLLLTAFSATTGLFQVVAGFLVDRIGARLLLMGGLAINGLAFGAIGFVDSYWAMVTLVAIGGIGNAVFHPADYVILNASVPVNRLGQAFSIHTFTGNVGFALAPPVMIALTAAFNWRIAMIIAGAMGLAVMAFVFFYGHVLQESTKTKKKVAAESEGKTGWRLLLSFPMLMMFAFWVTLTLASIGMQSFLVTALVTVQGIELGTATMVLTVLLSTGAIGILCGGYLADRTHRHALLVGGALALCAVLSVFGGYVALPVAGLVLVFGLIGFLQGSTRPSRDIMVRQITPERDIGKVFAFVTTGINVGGAISPFLFGLMLDHGDPRWIFASLAVFFVAGIATMGTTRLYAKPMRSPAPAE